IDDGSFLGIGESGAVGQYAGVDHRRVVGTHGGDDFVEIGTLEVLDGSLIDCAHDEHVLHDDSSVIRDLRKASVEALSCTASNKTMRDRQAGESFSKNYCGSGIVHTRPSRFRIVVITRISRSAEDSPSGLWRSPGTR